MAIEAGFRLGHYDIEGQLGAGGMAEVYAAVDSRLGRKVALKVLHADSSDPVNLDRFEREARTVAALNHPNIVTIFSVEEVGDLRFIAMELVEGQTLSRAVPKDGVSLGRFFELAIPMTEALSAAHERGIVHRDLKPANIMVNRDDRIKILDFGIAKLWREEDKNEDRDGQPLTQHGTVVGTVPYMSPEQVQGKEMDHRSDIFSIGVVFYEMLTGIRPFSGSTSADLISSILRDSPMPISRLKNNVPRHLAQIVEHCLVKDVGKRRQSALDLRNELESLKKDIESGELTLSGQTHSRTAPLTNPPTAAQETAVTRVRTAAGSDPFPWKKLLSVGLGLLLAGAVVWMWRKFERSPPDFMAGQTLQITHEGGMEASPALSRDGKMVAYTAGGKLFVRQLSGGNAIPVTRDFTGLISSPQWSPDGANLVFENKEGLFTVPALGGAPRRLWSLDGARTWEFSPTYAPDGRHLAYVERDTIYIRQLPDGKPERVIDAAFPNSLAFAPNGRSLVYVSGHSAPSNEAPSAIVVVDLASKQSVVVREATFMNISPVWVKNSRQLLFLSNEGGTTDLYQLSVNHPQQVHRITTGLNARTISLSEDGRRMVYSRLEVKSNVWTLPIPKGEAVSVTRATPVTTGSQRVEGFSLSPDGTWITFDSNRSGRGDIFKMPVKGGEPRQLTTHEQGDFLPAWSPDGRWIAFHSYRDGPRNIFLVDPDGGEVTRVTSGTEHVWGAVWAPESRRLLFFSERGPQIATLQGETWSVPTPLAFVNGVCLNGSWSPDGSWLVLKVYSDKLNLWIVRPDGSQAHQLVSEGTSLMDFGNPSFSKDGQKVYYFGKHEETEGLWAVPLDGGDRQLVLHLNDPTRASIGDLESDGTHFFLILSEIEGDIWSMDMWMEQ